MRKRIVTLGAAALLVVGASLVATAQTDESTDDDSAGVGPHRIVESVLDELVGDDVITEDQSQAISEALVDKWEEVKAERKELFEDRRAEMETVRGFLEDDVISADELAQLPEDSILRDVDGPFAEALEDGEITRDELENAGAFLRGFRRGHRHGAMFGSATPESGA